MRAHQQLLERLVALRALTSFEARREFVFGHVAPQRSFSTAQLVRALSTPSVTSTPSYPSGSTATASAPSWNGLIVAGSFAAGTIATCEARTDQTVEQTADTEMNPYSLADIVPSGSFPKSIVLYQYEVCPFCCKVKAFLDFHNVPYRVVEVDPLGKSQLAWSEYKKVPVVVIDDTKQVNNSSSIISQLSVDLDDAGKTDAMNTKTKRASSTSWSFSKSIKVDRSKEETWRRWVDEKLVRAITVNIYRNARESFQTFDYITEHGNFGWFQKNAARIVGATMMWSLSNRLKKKYGIEGDAREALYGLADDWVRGMDGHPFMGGERPSLADIEAFGVIRSIVGTDTFNDLQHKTNIGAWWARMLDQVGESSRIQ